MPGLHNENKKEVEFSLRGFRRYADEHPDCCSVAYLLVKTSRDEEHDHGKVSLASTATNLSRLRFIHQFLLTIRAVSMAANKR